MSIGPSGRQVLGRAAMVGWLTLGTLAVWFAPKAPPMSPDAAEDVFGANPSAASAAPGGLLVLHRALSALGYSVALHNAPEPPEAEVWFMSPPEPLSASEVEHVASWVADRRGRLVYAPPADQNASSDPLWLRLEGQGNQPSQVSGDAVMWAMGQGRVLWLTSGALPLTNHALRDGVGQLPQWLGWVLDGATHVVFDEGRLRSGNPEGLWAALQRSRFAAALNIGCVAFFCWLIAAGMRRVPAQPEAPAGSRSFAEHIDAVADVLARGERAQLAAAMLRRGVELRLGPLARREPVQRVMGQQPRQGGTQLALWARALRAVEVTTTGDRSPHVVNLARHKY